MVKKMAYITECSGSISLQGNQKAKAAKAAKAAKVAKAAKAANLFK